MLKVALGVRYVGSLVCAVGSVYVVHVDVVVVVIVVMYVEQQHNHKHHVHDTVPWRTCESRATCFATGARKGAPVLSKEIQLPAGEHKVKAWSSSVH